MAGTGAQRQRRYRAHKAGDHTLCDPHRCNPDTVTVTPVVAVDGVPSSLGDRGSRLWRETTAPGSPELRPAERVLLEEACRAADRLDDLDRILRGDQDVWLRLRIPDGGSDVTVVIGQVLAEVRQQQVALKQLLAELRQSRAATGAGTGRRIGAAAATRTVSGRGGGVADLTARIAERRTAG